MKLFHSIAELSTITEHFVLVGGTFDGVHIGHQALIARAQEEAKEYGGRVVVMTFDQHPAAFLRPEKAPKLLSSLSKKRQLFERLDVDILLQLPFNASLAATTAEQFIQQLAAASPQLKAICVGANWAFGQGGKGNITLLRRLGKELHFSVITIDPVQIEGEIVSSTRIRNAIATGNLKAAADCLGRSYALTGRVVHGEGRGKTLGFPTANIFIEALQLPPCGVYAATAFVKNSSYKAAVNIGFRPTVTKGSGHLTVEAHLLDFTGDLYDHEITLTFFHFLREEKSFVSLAALKDQVTQDVENIKNMID